MEHFFIMPVVFVVFLGIYFMPSIVAFARNHTSFIGILILNLFLGWSLIGWIVALAWSFSDVRMVLLRRGDFHLNTPLGEAEALEKLAALRDKGVLTAEEFEGKKRQILGL